MEIFDIRDIDFSKLALLDILSSESSVYFDDKLVYKLYDDLLTTQKINTENKEKKLILLNDAECDFNAIIPHILIKNKCKIYGCAMKYLKDTNSLVKYKNTDIFMLLLYSVSLSLKKIHGDPRNISVGDLHFNNILIDKKGKHYFIDFDSCKIDGIEQDRLPSNFMRYIYNRNCFEYEVNFETDKLCMILSLINSLFGKDIDNLSIYEYDEKAEQIYTLKNLRNYILNIKSNTESIPFVPYLHEIISINDFPGTKRIKNIR